MTMGPEPMTSTFFGIGLAATLVTKRRRPRSHWRGCAADRVGVFLGCDVNAAGGEFLHGMIAAAMAELELERLRAERAADHLVPQANAEDRDLARQVPDDLYGVVEDLGVAGAGREQHAVGLERFDDGGGGGRRHEDY